MKRERLIEILQDNCIDSYGYFKNVEIAADLTLDEIEKSKAPDKAGEREGAEDDARDAQYKAEQAEEAECDALFRAETAEAEITRLQAIIAALAPKPTETEAGRGVIPAGWKLVPEKPTPEMLKAGYGEHWSWSSGRAYRAMIAATPTPPLSPDSTEPEILAAQIRLGEGLTDITRIDHEGKTGVLFRPRTQHIPNGDPGELPAGEYWPVPGDVVLWVGPDGAQVAIDALVALTPSAPIAAPVRDDGARELIVQAMQSAWDEWVHDTGCFPGDFRIERGPKLFFEAGQWATLAADEILASLPAPAGDVPGKAQTKLST